ncbi:MAG: hypothetical protein WCR95_07370, partial [Eubacteriales bacterium]
RYLGVVEAAGSSPVTQTRKSCLLTGFSIIFASMGEIYSLRRIKIRTNIISFSVSLSALAEYHYAVISLAKPISLIIYYKNIRIFSVRSQHTNPAG